MYSKGTPIDWVQEIVCLLYAVLLVVAVSTVLFAVVEIHSAWVADEVAVYFFPNLEARMSMGLIPGFFLGLSLTLFTFDRVYSILRGPLLATSLSRQMNPRSMRTAKIVFIAISIAFLAQFIVFLDHYVIVDEAGITYDPFWGTDAKQYTFKDVERLIRAESFQSLAGKRVREPTFFIRFQSHPIAAKQ